MNAYIYFAEAVIGGADPDGERPGYSDAAKGDGQRKPTSHEIESPEEPEFALPGLNANFRVCPFAIVTAGVAVLRFVPRLGRRGPHRSVNGCGPLSCPTTNHRYDHNHY